MGQPFFAYVLLCADGSYYVGHTDDLERRINEHEAGEKCAYTETRRPIRLVWSQEFAAREDALAAELQIKRWSRAKKEALIRADAETLRREARKKNWPVYRARKGRP
jgi:predicted GIY-YIG superfamily endonuclease